jgi:hypothetical protein
MKYQVYAKKVNGSVEKWDAPKTLTAAMNTIKGMTRFNKLFYEYLYWYCLPVKEEEEMNHESIKD